MCVCIRDGVLPTVGLSKLAHTQTLTSSAIVNFLRTLWMVPLPKHSAYTVSALGAAGSAQEDGVFPTRCADIKQNHKEKSAK